MEASATSILPNSVSLLTELDSLQDDVLRQLDELNQQVEKAIVSSQLHVRSPEVTLTRFQQ